MLNITTFRFVAFNLVSLHIHASIWKIEKITLRNNLKMMFFFKFAVINETLKMHKPILLRQVSKDSLISIYSSCLLYIHRRRHFEYQNLRRDCDTIEDLPIQRNLLNSWTRTAAKREGHN